MRLGSIRETAIPGAARSATSRATLEQLRGEHREAILAALAPLDTQKHALESTSDTFRVTTSETRRPILFGLLNDRARLSCHLHWYLAENAENNVAHGRSMVCRARH